MYQGKPMQIEISKSDYKALLELSERCVAIIKSKEPTIREYNAARRLGLVIRKLQKKNRGLPE